MTATRPVVGITCFSGVWDFDCGEWPILAIERAYVDGLVESGADVVMLTRAPGDASRLLSRLDGLLVSGGPDVDPTLYEAARDPRTGPADFERDAFEITLVRDAVRRRLPTLGICRGIQLINVALGGSLYQHVEHAHLSRPRDSVHSVDVAEGSRLASVLGGTSVSVNSLHHQAVQRVAPGLVSSGLAPDGGVEAVEHVAAPLLAVQWHPEMQDDKKVARALFGWLTSSSLAGADAS